MDKVIEDIYTYSDYEINTNIEYFLKHNYDHLFLLKFLKYKEFKNNHKKIYSKNYYKGYYKNYNKR